MPNKSADFYSPHVLDDTPISVSPVIRRHDLVRQFRQAADRFRAVVSQSGTVTRNGVPTRTHQAALERARLSTLCGELLIKARDWKLIPTDQVELLSLIDWHTQPASPMPPGAHVQYSRSPHNLFHDIRGGGRVRGVIRFDADGLAHIDNPVEVGGLMPRWHKGHLSRSPAERDVETCEFLAALLEITSTEAKRSQEVGPYADGCFRYPPFDIKRMALLRWKLLCALWDFDRGEPADPRSVHDVFSAVYGKGRRFNRPKLKDLWEELAAVFSATDNAQLGWEVDVGTTVPRGKLLRMVIMPPRRIEEN